MTISRRTAMSISGATLAGLSLGVVRPESLPAAQAAGQQDWPDELVERLKKFAVGYIAETR